jgi:3-hydroxybutyryl-CoA dehydrogenase
MPGEVIGVIGAGTMGAGIAQIALQAGHEVVLHDVDEAALRRGRERIREGMARTAARLGLDAMTIDDWVEGRESRLREALTLDAVAGEADVVIEAAIEDLDLKRTVFQALDQDALPDAILASNTSALSIDAIASATSRPERVIGLHFFNPAPVMPLVEVVRGTRSDPEAVQGAAELVSGWDKTTVTCADTPGFIVNRVNRPFTLEALSLLEAGEGSVEAIDAAVRAAGYPMGPFELMDLTGIDITLRTTEAIHAAMAAAGDPLADRFSPSPLAARFVEEGRLGRKTGVGFYPDDAARAARGPVTLPLGTDVVERIELAIVNEAWRARDDGVASGTDIDLALRLGARHPEGPFERWAARGGADAIRTSLERFRDAGPRFVPAAGLSGR